MNRLTLHTRNIRFIINVQVYFRQQLHAWNMDCTWKDMGTFGITRGVVFIQGPKK